MAIGFVCVVSSVGVCGSVLCVVGSQWIWLCEWWIVYVWLDNVKASGWVERGGCVTHDDNIYVSIYIYKPSSLQTQQQAHV